MANPRKLTELMLSGYNPVLVLKRAIDEYGTEELQ